MISEEVISYIRKAHSLKVSDQQITTDLQRSGWTLNDIQQGFAQESGKVITEDLTPPMKPAAVNAHGMWDAFEHILLFISLYVMATSIAVILYFLVDKWSPSSLAAVSSNAYINDTAEIIVRGFLAALIVSLPLFIFFYLDITKRTLKDATMRNIRARKILIYITLVTTFLTMLGHIIGVIFSLLSGSVDLNSVLHLLVTLLINGIIFAYYLLQVKEDRSIHA